MLVGGLSCVVNSSFLLSFFNWNLDSVEYAVYNKELRPCEITNKQYNSLSLVVPLQLRETVKCL